MITIATNLTHETMATCQPVHQLVEINMAWKMILLGEKKKQNHVTTSKKLKMESFLLCQVQENLYVAKCNLG